MSAVARGSYVVRASVEYRDDLRGFSPDAFAMRMHALMIEVFGRSTVLAPNAPVNPAVQTWRSVTPGPRLWVARIAFAIVTSGTTTGAVADVVARAFREAGAGSDVDAADLARKLDEGDDAPFSWFTGPFGRVSMSFERVAAAPSSVSPEPIRASTVEAWQHATVRQGERVVVPDPVRPGSSTPAPTQAPPPPPTDTPYGGTPEDPVLPGDPGQPRPQPSAPSWAPAAALAAAAVLLLVVAVSVDPPAAVAAKEENEANARRRGRR